MRRRIATVQVCFGDILNASCASGSVLMIDNAVYGRMKVNACGTSNVNIGCYADVTSYMEQHCAGRRHCKMAVRNEMQVWAANNQGCPRDQIGYLQLTYYCLPGKHRLLLLLRGVFQDLPTPNRAWLLGNRSLTPVASRLVAKFQIFTLVVTEC